jgi:hypothetical protein
MVDRAGDRRALRIEQWRRNPAHSLVRHGVPATRPAAAARAGPAGLRGDRAEGAGGLAYARWQRRHLGRARPARARRAPGTRVGLLFDGTDWSGYAFADYLPVTPGGSRSGRSSSRGGSDLGGASLARADGLASSS